MTPNVAMTLDNFRKNDKILFLVMMKNFDDDEIFGDDDDFVKWCGHDNLPE